MAHSTLIMRNKSTGEVIGAPVGFSWTTLLFGMFPALFRGDWKHSLIIGGTIILAAVAGLAFVPLIAFAFLYNRMYIRSLLDTGNWTVDISNLSAHREIKIEDSIGYKLKNFAEETVVL